MVGEQQNIQERSHTGSLVGELKKRSQCSDGQSSEKTLEKTNPKRLLEYASRSANTAAKSGHVTRNWKNEART
jgi:hypothetical protein